MFAELPCDRRDGSAPCLPPGGRREPAMRTKAYDRDELARTLFEESGDALFLFDPDSGELLDANPTAQRLSGFPLAVLRRLPVSSLFRSEAAHGVQRLRQACRKSGVFH